MKKNFLLLVMAMLFSSVATFANNSTYYFNKVTVSASGAGKVYASTEQTEDPQWAEEVVLDNLGSKSASSAPTTTIYLYAQPDEGYEVAEWSTPNSTDLSAVQVGDPNTTATVSVTGNTQFGNENFVVVKFKKSGLEDGSLELDTTSMRVDIDATGKISVTSQSHEAPITWSSDNEGTVKVDAETGEWIALKYGVAVLTATLSETSEYTSAIAQCTVAVNDIKSVYQVQNGGFELWDDEGTVNIEPTNWNSFQHAAGSFASTARAQQIMQSDEVRPGSDGRYSARIYARSVIGVLAQGNMTTGCINAGTMSASDANGNYNFTDTSREGFNQSVIGLPDAIHVWAKSQCSQGASIACQLHTVSETSYFQDPVGTQDGHTNAGAFTVAEARNGTIASSDEWQELIIPFEYNDIIMVTDSEDNEENNDEENTENNGGESQSFHALYIPTDTIVRPEYALITVSTSGTPGVGSASDYMLIDDLEFLYYSELLSAVYNGDMLTFEDNVATVDDIAYDEELMDIKSTGRGAAIETDYQESIEGNLLTITIKGDNISDDPENYHTYTVNFIVATSLDELSATAAPARQDDAIYNMAGQRVSKATKGVFIRNGKKILK